MRAFELYEGTEQLNIDPDKLVSFIAKNCPVAYKRAKQGYHIFRGIPFLDYDVIQVTPKVNRVSPHATNNLYNILLSNLSNWKVFPKRNQSVICTTSMTVARHYGTPTMVFPKNNPRIGVCSESDLWTSFPHMSQILDISSLDTFATTLETLIEELLDTNVDDENYTEVLKDFKDLERLWKEDSDTMIAKFDSTKNKVFEWPPEHRCLENLFDYIFKENNGNVRKAIAHLLDPKLNKFRCMSLSKFNAVGDQEVWFSDSCLLVSLFNDEILEILDGEFGLEL